MAADSDPSGIPIGQAAPGTKQFTITPSDTLNLDGTASGTTVIARAILVNDTGPVTVSLIAFNDTVAKIWRGLVAGDIIPMYAKRVTAANTTATDLLGLA